MRELVACQRTSTAAPALYFERWIDHATWPQWSPDTTWARVDGSPGARTAFRKVATSVPADLDRLITVVEAG